MTSQQITKNNVFFQSLKVESGGYFTAQIDAWDLPESDQKELKAKEDELLDVDGYVYFDMNGNITKVYGMRVWNGNKSVSLNPNPDLIFRIEEYWAKYCQEGI